MKIHKSPLSHCSKNGKQKFDIIKQGDLVHCDFIFITVPTPFDCDKNTVDESAIIESLDKIESIGFKKIVIIKSTVPPGSCTRYLNNYSFDITFNPVYSTECTCELYKKNSMLAIWQVKSIFINLRNKFIKCF